MPVRLVKSPSTSRIPNTNKRLYTYMFMLQEYTFVYAVRLKIKNNKSSAMRSYI